MALAWGTRAVLEEDVVNYESMVRFARRNSNGLLVPTDADRIVVIAGIPFGTSGSKNDIRIVRPREPKKVLYADRTVDSVSFVSQVPAPNFDAATLLFMCNRKDNLRMQYQ